jgi:hypothetical protein
MPAQHCKQISLSALCKHQQHQQQDCHMVLQLNPCWLPVPSISKASAQVHLLTTTVSAELQQPHQ